MWKYGSGQMPAFMLKWFCYRNYEHEVGACMWLSCFNYRPLRGESLILRHMPSEWHQGSVTLSLALINYSLVHFFILSKKNQARVAHPYTCQWGHCISFLSQYELSYFYSVFKIQRHYLCGVQIVPNVASGSLFKLPYGLFWHFIYAYMYHVCIYIIICIYWYACIVIHLYTCICAYIFLIY